MTLKINNLSSESIDEVLRRNAQTRYFKQRTNSGNTAKQLVSIADSHSGISHWCNRDRLRRDGSGQQLRRRFEPIEDFSGARGLAERRASDDGDDSAHETTSLRRADARHGCNKVVSRSFGLLDSGGFDHDSYKGFSATGPDQHPSAIAQICLNCGNVGRKRISEKYRKIVSSCRQFHVTQDLRKSFHCARCELGKRNICSTHHIHKSDTRKYSVTGCREISEHDVSRLFSPQRTPGASESFEYMAITDRGFDDVNALLVHR
jgi:hypothetical protein